MATLNDRIALAIITIVNDGGELTTDEIVSSVRALDGFDEVEIQPIERQVTKLDRDGKLTRRNAEAGWQLTANGRGALDGLRSKMEARYIAPYKDWVPVEAVFTLLAPCLGPITDAGNQGVARFPRLGEIVDTIERPGLKKKDPPIIERKIVRAGEIILYGGWIRAAMQKAAERGESTIIVDGAGMRRTLPDVAWGRVTVKPIIFPSDTRTERAVRRPTNSRGMSVGEILHECLPPGTVLTIRASFPISHFSEMYLIRLFEQLGDMGISPAGTGKGGIWGIGMVSSLKINGRQVWPDHPDAVAASGAVTGEAEAVAVAYQTITANPADTEDDDEDTDDDPRSRVKAGSVTYVNGANRR